MKKILLLVLFLLPNMAYSQDRLVKVTFTETRRHLAIAIKTPDPINPGSQGEFRVQFSRGEFVVYPDTATKNGTVRRVEFDIPKNMRVVKVIFFVPGEKPFGLEFSRNLFSIPLPGQPEENPSKLVFTIGEDADGDGFPGSAVIITDSQKWNLLLDSND